MCTMMLSWKEDDIKDAIVAPTFLSRGTKFASYWVESSNRLSAAHSSVEELPALVDRLSSAQPAARIVHVQSPTRTSFKAHPSVLGAESDPSMLWHNGQLVTWNRNVAEWDTEYINSALYRCDPTIEEHRDIIQHALAALQGAFACIWYTGGELYIFRNAMAPLFISTTSICSLPLTQEHLHVPKNVVFRVIQDTHCLQISEILRFNNTYNPYGLT